MHRIILLVLVALGCEPGLAQTQPVPSPCPTNSGITLTPYVVAQSPETVVVQWQTAQPAYGWVEYGATPALGRQQDATAYGLRVANVKEHRVTPSMPTPTNWPFTRPTPSATPTPSSSAAATKWNKPA